MSNKNYFFTKGPCATELEKAQNDQLNFVFINGKHGDTFNKKVGKVCGYVPKHLQDFEIPPPAIEEPKTDPADELFG